MEVSNLFSVSDKIVLVTGGGRGIGKMIADGFVRNGAKVYIASRNYASCKKAAAELKHQGPGTCIALQGDISSEKGCAHLAQQFASYESKLDVLVNNSGIAIPTAFDKHEEKVWQETFSVNVAAAYFLARDLLPQLDRAADLNGSARIINIGSVAGFSPSKMDVMAYDASKAALHHLTRVLAAKLARRPNGGHINVNAIAPGVIPTDMTEIIRSAAASSFNNMGRTLPLGRCGDSKDIAGVALFLASRASEWITGIVVVVDGGHIRASFRLPLAKL
ncbi:unnamed protein product [Albugo candida]|uniref:Uncharacterized protein n=1 Tax=Albugo candida TaxID=65357 RepID=A0A024G718_9STRA|nr:unnamed protein product [Albugo candida]|eukprot:CCI42434.1 unnamed protein product [Albugo candida]